MPKKKKEEEKRRIVIEDKRSSAIDEETTADQVNTDATDPKLLEFTEGATDTADGFHMMDGTGTDQAESLRQQVAKKSNETDEAPKEEQVPSLEEQVAVLHEKVLKKEAEFQNYRKRVHKDMDDARRFAVENLLADLFPAFDGMAQALATYKEVQDKENPLLDGMRRTAKVMENALSKHGIEKINEAPVPFDAELHQVLNVEDSEEVAEDTVTEVYVEGYRLGEIILKPAMVKVVKPQ